MLCQILRSSLILKASSDCVTSSGPPGIKEGVPWIGFDRIRCCKRASYMLLVQHPHKDKRQVQTEIVRMFANIRIVGH